MARVEHYKGLQTNIDNLYNSIKRELEQEKDLKIVSEIKGEMNGDSDDFAIEVSSGSWFESLLIPGATGFVGGPLGAVGGTSVGLIMAYQFERKIWKRISEVVDKESKNKVTTQNIEHYSK
jgi:hypothetical protein